MNKGYGIIEIIVAMALFVTIATVGITTVIGSFSTNRLGEEHTQASLIAQEGIEAARSLRNQDWTTGLLATPCTTGCGLSSSGGSWVVSGTGNTVGKFYRTVAIEDTQRDGSGIIVTSGGTNDPDTKRIRSTVTWDFTPARQNTVELVTYLTNFAKTLGSNWAVPQILGSFDFTNANSGSNTTNGISVAYLSTNIYIGRQTGGGSELLMLDTADPTTPSLCVACQRSIGGNVNDIEIDGSYLYLATSSNGSELQVVDISNPTNLASSPLTSLDLTAGNSGSGTADAIAIAKSGSNLYMIRAGGNEFIRFDVSNPMAPSINGTNAAFNGTPTDMVIVGSHAYVTSTSNTNEIQIFDLSTLNRVGTENMNSSNNNADALSIEVISTTRIAVGRQSSGAPELYVYDISTPTNPSLTNEVEIGANVVDISYGNNLLYILTSNTTNDFQVFDASNPDAISPTPYGVFDLQNSPLIGVYDSVRDMYFSVGSSDGTEFEILQGQ